MRICLFTDTLADVNGVSRFIQNVAAQALRAGRDLHVLTSTRFACPDQPNIHNFAPVYSRPMPGYANLDAALPPARAVLRRASALAPDAVHVSTPGAVGLLGLWFARREKLPVLGVYHTDFPAYIDHLFGDEAFTWLTAAWMRFVYKRFARIFTRSDDYARSLVSLGIDRSRLLRLLPGIDTDVFHPRWRDPGVWGRLGVDGEAVKVLYVGRVSVEKNLPVLAKVWPRARRECLRRGVRAQLVVVGDGPYRLEMEAELGVEGAVFLGFRFGQELSAIYASSDVFVFPSVTDTLGQVVMESQSAGLPVVVTDRGGPAEVVEHGKTGFVLPASDHGAWVRVLADLASDAGLRRRMGASAHEKIRPLSIRHSFEHFWSVHAEALGSSRGGAEGVRTGAAAGAG